MSDHLRESREQKLRKLRELGIPEHPDSFNVTASLSEAGAMADKTKASVAGRIMRFHTFKEYIFADLRDIEGKLQVVFSSEVLPAETYEWVSQCVDLGDLVGVSGELFTTRRKEKTLMAHEVTFLGKCLHPLPEKYHPFSDPEARARKRYLDLIANEESRRVFLMRSRIITFIRTYLDREGFIDIETPSLQKEACGASARPFVTHHNALDMDLYLRISPETYLKRLIVGGFTKVYEIGKSFRNEGLDQSHLQEFTMLEYYVAYWNAARNLAFIRDFIQAIVQEFCGGLRVEYQGKTLDFSGDWEQCKYTDLVLQETGIDLSAVESLEQLRSEIQRKGLDVDCEKYISLGSLMDALYKKTVRPKLIQPMFLTQHPAELVPLARRNDDNPRVLDMFQVVVNGWEIVKAYSELVDPAEQKARLLAQADTDDEAMMLELDYIECMEHGMPPNSGLGLGIDRLVALLTNQRRLKDVIPFPLIKPEKPLGENSPNT